MPLIQQSGSGSVAIGIPIDGGTSGSVLFVDGTGRLAQNNASFTFDDSTHSLNVIGSTNALNNLQAESGYAAFTFTSYRNSSITHGLFEGLAARGTSSVPLAINSGDSLFRISACGYDTTTETFYTTGSDVSAQIDFVAEEAFSSGTNKAGAILLQTTPTGAQFKVTRVKIAATGSTIFSTAGAASTPIVSLTGAIFTGGSATTTFPYHYHDVTGATAVTSWSTAGTFIGLNSATGFTGNFLDFHINGASSTFRVTSTGNIDICSNVGKIGFGASSPDIAISRISSSSLEINNNTPGTLRDLSLRILDATNTITSASIITSTYPGGASTPAIRTTGALFTGGSSTTNVPQWLSQAASGTTAVTSWSTAGTYFGINAASGFTGNFFDFYVNGSAVSTARMSYDGTFTILMGSAGSVSMQSGGLRIQTGSSGFVIFNGTGSLAMPTDGTLRIRNDGATANLPITISTTSALFGSGGTYGDLFEFRNSTTAQTLRIYGTFTDASNYSRFKITYSGGVYTCGPEYSGTSTSANVVFGSSGATDATFLDGGGALYFRVASTNRFYSTGNNLLPYTDNAVSLGGTSNRWNKVWVGTGGIDLTGSLVGATGSFSGDVTVPTQSAGDSTTKIASTEFVTEAISASQEIFVQDDAPETTGPAIWIQTGLGVGGDDFTMWMIY